MIMETLDCLFDDNGNMNVWLDYNGNTWVSLIQGKTIVWLDNKGNTSGWLDNNWNLMETWVPQVWLDDNWNTSV